MQMQMQMQMQMGRLRRPVSGQKHNSQRPRVKLTKRTRGLGTVNSITLACQIGLGAAASPMRHAEKNGGQTACSKL